MKEINNYQRFLSGEYCNYLDAEVLEMIVKTQKCLSVLNDITTTEKERKEILSKMLGSIGNHSSIGYNFTCQCGKHIFIGEKTIINNNCTMMDENHIHIGDRVRLLDKKHKNTRPYIECKKGVNLIND